VKIVETFMRWITMRMASGMPLPDGGRSSVEPLSGLISGALANFGTVSHVIDFEMLCLLKKLSIFNPDFSQYVSNIITLGNTGHQVMIDAPSSQRAEAAAQRLNEAASRLYDNGAGVDGLFNAYLRQIAWSGALSSEDVVDIAGRRVERVVIVPVEQIRFQYVEGRYMPYQQPNTLAGLNRNALGLIPLNENTYRYLALETVENSPYALPPGTAAVGAITGAQTDMMESIKSIVKKFGLLGLISFACTPPPKKPNETDAEYQARSKKYLASVADAVKPSIRDGLLLHYRDQKADKTSITGDARGASDLWQLNEQQVISGLRGFPAFFGRTDSTTETYADVVYNFVLAQAWNVQRLVKRRHESTCRLDLRLGGIEVDGVSVQFNRAHARDPLKEAEAEQIKVQTAILKAEAGIISPDQAAQELGYDSAYDAELLSSHPEAAGSLRRLSVGAGREHMTATFHFDRGAQRYRHIPQRIELSGAPVEVDTYVPVHKFTLKKKAA
jgi:hypothetical protein